MNGKFTVDQKELINLLSLMQSICSKKTTLEATESILFQVAPKELILKSTDLEISLQSSMAIESDLIENNDFLISGKRIFDLVKELDDKIEFVFENNQLNLKASGVDLALNIREKEDFPAFPERIENLMQLDSLFLQELLSKVVFLIPQNNSNAALNGMLIEFNDKEMSFVVTDGHRLAIAKTDKYKLGEEKRWLLPRRAVLELKKILENSANQNVFLGVCGNQLVFSGINFNFFTKLISDPFPNYSPVLEKEGFKPACVDRESFLKTLKRASCLLSGQFVSTNFKFTPSSLDVSLFNKEVGKLEESLILKDFDGSNIESKYYSPYLLAGLQVFEESKLDFYVHSDARPIIFEAKKSDYSFFYLVMPVSTMQDE